jgi:predicted dehydrogenase
VSNKIRLGIIGFGAEGAAYADFITKGMVPNMVVGAISDVNPAIEAKAHELSVLFFSDYKSMITSGEVDAVVTTVPHYLHPEVGIYALQNGVHALVEKPIGVYTKQAQRLIQVAASKPELKFGVFFNQRTNPLYKDLHELITSGELGALRHSSWIITNWWRPQGYYDSSAWRATWGGEGGGVLVNQAPHQLDLWQWICGVPKSVFAKAQFGFRRDIAVEDEVNALVSFADGATGSFMTATHDLMGTDRLEILLDKGKVVVENSKDVTIWKLNKPEQEISKGMDMEAVAKLFRGQLDTSTFMSKETKSYSSVWGEQHSEVMRNFAAACLGEEELMAPGDQGIHGVRLANAIHLSSWTGQEVSIEHFDEDEYLEQLNNRIRQEGKYSERD